MKRHRKGIIPGLLVILLAGCSTQQQYEPTWGSLRQHDTPEWLRDGKFGIYTHWGPYAVHAYGSNTTWYSFAVYEDPESEARMHFEENFGKLTPDFGYKDLIPMFTAEKFDADEWAELFKKAGARFAGPVAEHHDGFAMWDTKYSEWNAATMGPKRDVVGELETAIKDHGMKFVTAFHHAANMFFFPTWDERYDTGNPEYAGLYGPLRPRGVWPPQLPSQEFTDEWYGKIIEVIDNYDPDFIWFDFGLDYMHDSYTKKFLAYYYNKSLRDRDEVVVTFKGHDLPPGVGLVDLELGQAPRLTEHEWITDTSVDDRGAWGYANDLIFKTPNRLVDNLVDRVSKNGYLLLNVGPKADGTIPEGAKEALLDIGEWLEINGEAIYETTPWILSGEGATSLEDHDLTGFNESDIVWTAEDIRFTVKDDVLYATFLDWPGEKAVIPSLAGMHRLESDGDDEEEEEEDEEAEGEEEEEEEEEGDEETEFIGLYESEIIRISMLGDGKSLDWELTNAGLVIDTPSEKPCEHAFVFKIERKPPF